jgi:hydrogenase expression/formation protein HypC
MCVTYPGQVLGVADGMADVLVQGQRRRASLVVVPEAAPGDWVFVAAGTVLEILGPDDAAEILALLGPADQPTEG